MCVHLSIPFYLNPWSIFKLYIYIHVKPFMHTKCVSARQTGSAHAQQNAVPGVINSMTHPDAWQWLNRACKKQIVPEEVYNDWMSGGARRNQLLANFVQRVHRPGDSQQANLLRLEAFIKIRQCTKDVTKSLKGYEWHTKDEMKDDLKWSEPLKSICCHVFFVYFLCEGAVFMCPQCFLKCVVCQKDETS